MVSYHYMIFANKLVGDDSKLTVYNVHQCLQSCCLLDQYYEINQNSLGKLSLYNGTICATIFSSRIEQ
jgi:hypothetical protein